MSRWFVMLLVGVCTGLVAVIIDFSIEKLTEFKYGIISESEQEFL